MCDAKIHFAVQEITCPHCKNSLTTPPKHALEGMLLASIAPAMRSFLEGYEDLLTFKARNTDYLAGLLLECCTSLLSEAEKFERGEQ